MRLRAFGLAAALALAACDSGPDRGFTDISTLSQDPTLLVGVWELERTASYWDGGIHRPAPPGGETIELAADGAFVVSRFGERVTTTTYTTEARCRADDPAVCFVELEIEGRGGQQWGVDARTLVLSTAYRDGDERVYQRIGR